MQAGVGCALLVPLSIVAGTGRDGSSCAGPTTAVGTAGRPWLTWRSPNSTQATSLCSPPPREREKPLTSETSAQPGARSPAHRGCEARLLHKYVCQVRIFLDPGFLRRR